MRYYETPRKEIDYFREEYEFLSNFYPTKVMFEGITYYNAEAAYQAQKCSRYEDRFQFAHMSADEAKRLGCSSAVHCVFSLSAPLDLISPRNSSSCCACKKARS